jgi:hypothetical protein
VSKPGSSRFGFVEITGGKRVSVSRGKSTKKGKTVKVAVRNYNGKPSTWYKNKTKAVANRTRQLYARANPDARESYWAAQAKKTAKPKSRGEAILSSPAMTRTMAGSKSWGDSIKTDTGAAAAGAATGVAVKEFATVKDFEKWLAHMLKTSAKFRGVYASWLRKKRNQKTVAKKKVAKKGKSMKKATKKAAKRNARRKPAKRRVTKRAAARRPAKRRTTKRAAARRPAKRRTVRRRARRNMSMKARANQMFAQVKALAKPTAFVLGGMVAHRLISQFGVKLLSSVTNDTKIASVISNFAVLGLGAVASQKVSPTNSAMLSLGMAVNAGLSILGEFFPDAKKYLGLGLLAENTRSRYVLGGMGQPIMQAAAGTGEYFDPMGEYVSNDLYPSGGDFGEYVASNLDVQGYGDYEVEDTYALNGGSGYVDDGVRPDGDLGREFAMMEAKAGVGQPIMQAAAGMGQPIMQAAAGVPSASIYVPSQQAGLVGGSESSFDSGIFDIGGGNGVLS